jgi:hypothetical protein
MLKSGYIISHYFSRKLLLLAMAIATALFSSIAKLHKAKAYNLVYTILIVLILLKSPARRGFCFYGKLMPY